MKRVHESTNEDMKFFDCEVIPKPMWRLYYPLECRIGMMRLALIKIDVDDFRKSLIEELINTNRFSTKVRFEKFINILTEDELSVIGW